MISFIGTTNPRKKRRRDNQRTIIEFTNTQNENGKANKVGFLYQYYLQKKVIVGKAINTIQRKTPLLVFLAANLEMMVFVSRSRSSSCSMLKRDKWLRRLWPMEARCSFLILFSLENDRLMHPGAATRTQNDHKKPPRCKASRSSAEN